MSASTDSRVRQAGRYRHNPTAREFINTQASLQATRLAHDRPAGMSQPTVVLVAAVESARVRAAAEDGESAPKPPRGGRGRRRLRNRREFIGLVDLAALQRGNVEPGETCEIAGIGPVPVEVARRVFGDALLRIVIRDGTDIRTVVHTGRTANAVQETAVLVRDGGRCVRPTCGLPISEIDHNIGFPTTGPTTLDDLAGLCGHDHDLKSLHGHTYERMPDGRIRWRRPEGTIEEDRPPP